MNVLLTPASVKMVMFGDISLKCAVHDLERFPHVDMISGWYYKLFSVDFSPNKKFIVYFLCCSSC